MAHPICGLADEKVLVQMDDKADNRDYRELLCALVEPLGEYIDTIDDVINTFDIDTAVGDQLDKLGAWLALPRSGFDDVQYRRNLQIQIKIITSWLRLNNQFEPGDWTGTINNLLEIIRIFIGPIPGVITYFPSYPYSFIVTIPGNLSQLEIAQLFQFVRRSLYAAVLGINVFLQGNDNLWAHALDIGGGDGAWDVGAVVGEALWAHAWAADQVWAVNGLTFNDETGVFSSPAVNDYSVFSAGNTVGAYAAWGLSAPFEVLLFDNTGGVAGKDGIVVWEYWDGAAWQIIPVFVDGTNNFTNGPGGGQLVDFGALPIDWAPVSLNGEPELYYVRARITTIYSLVPIYDKGSIGSFTDGEYGAWETGAVANEGIWSGVITTSSDQQIRNDNT